MIVDIGINCKYPAYLDYIISYIIPNATNEMHVGYESIRSIGQGEQGETQLWLGRLLDIEVTLLSMVFPVLTFLPA